MSSWRTVPLKCLASLITGSTPPESEPAWWGNEVDFITPTDQSWDSRQAKVQRRLSTLGATELERRLVPAGSTQLTCIGSTIGKVSRAENCSVTNQQIVSIVSDPGVADAGFIYYLIKGWSPGLKALASGSATPIVNKSVLGAVRFRVPSPGTQRAIAEVLGALDDKIAANARLLTTADELSRVTYESLAATGEAVPLSSLAEFINGRAYTKDATGTGRVVVRIAELNSGIGRSTVYNDIDVPDKNLTRPGDLLFAWSGSLTVHRWFRPEAIVNQHIFKVIPRSVPMWVVKGALDRKLAEFRAIAADKATTMGHIQRRHLDEPVLVPEDEQIAVHDASLSALWDRALAAEQESLKLAETRDALLPGLMSGKIRVKDAESIVEEVV